MRVFGRHTGLVLAAAIPAIAGIDRIEIGTGPGLILRGTPATTASIESAATVSGPWTPLATVTVGPEGRMSMDLSPGSDSRFYRAVSGDTPTGPAGFVWIPAGTFVMGSPIDEVDRYTDEVQHTVTRRHGGTTGEMMSEAMPAGLCSVTIPSRSAARRAPVKGDGIR